MRHEHGLAEASRVEPCYLQENPEFNQPRPTYKSQRIKRQIKLFEKLLSKQKCRKKPVRTFLKSQDDDAPSFFFGEYTIEQPRHLSEQEDKPTFFFGDDARAQFVEPIEGDSHFDHLPRSFEELYAVNELND